MRNLVTFKLETASQEKMMAEDSRKLEKDLE